MGEFTMDDVAAAMRECAGDDDALDLTGRMEDATFDELGFDSLAVLELTSLVERRWGVELPEDDMAGVVSPAQFLAEAGARVTAARAAA